MIGTRLVPFGARRRSIRAVARVRMALPPTPELLAAQADYYGRTLRSCLAVRRCDTYTVWGFTDAHSWVPGWFDGEGAATPLDEDYRPKPVYAALADALREGRPGAGDGG